MNGPARLALCVTALTLFLAGCTEKQHVDEVTRDVPRGTRPVASESLKASLRDAAASAERARDYKSAASFYNSLHARNEGDVAATIGLARNLRYMGSVETAARILEEALVNSPNEPGLVRELGKAQLAGGQPEKALATLMRVREKTPRDWHVHSAIGIAFDRLGRYESGRLSYEAALELSPNNASVLNNMALSYVQTGDLDRGIELLVHAAALPSSTIQVRQNLALLYALKGDVAAAEKLARRDLPEDMVRSNLEYYRRLAASRSSRGAKIMKPVSVSQALAARPGMVPILIGPWEEDTDAERVSGLPRGG